MEEKYVFLIHWNAREANEYANQLRAEGYDVEVEARDGSRARDSIRKDPPDAVAIFLSRQPSLGRQTAVALKKLRRMQNVPLIFVDGRDDAVVKAVSEFEGATFTKSSEIAAVLERLLAPKRRGRFYWIKKWF